MRQFCTTFALALLVSFTMSDAAEAGKKGKKKKKGDDVVAEETVPADTEEAAAEEPAPEKEEPTLAVEMTGIADVDTLFTKAVAPLETLASVRASLNKVNSDLATVLGLPAGTPFADALADLSAKAEGKISVAISEQGMPKLQPSDAVPENVQGAIDAVNNGMNEVMTAAAGLAELPAQFQEIAAAAAGFNPKSLMDSGVKPMEAPKIMKKITGNLKVVAAAPEQVTMLTASVDETKTTISSAFAAPTE